MQLKVEPYLEQVSRWPNSGKVIMAQYDEQSVIVYQAYNQSIGRFAAEHGHFGGDFSYSRMTWIKPNFLWMMYRSGWGAKDGQEVTLAVKLKRSAFDQILRRAVHSTFDSSAYTTCEAWQLAVRKSDVRLQWDPDHDTMGEKLERRAIQLGLRGEAIEHYGKEWILEIEDISDFVSEQRKHIGPEHRERLYIPCEAIYPVDDEILASRLGLQ
jgi:hypothetical protein